MKLRCKITALVMCGIMVLSIGTTVLADPTADSLNQQKQQLQNQEQQNNKNMQQSQLNADNAQKDINSINTQIEKLDSQIGVLQSTISDTNAKISAKESEIQVSQNNLNKAEADIESDQILFNKRIRAMYEGEYDQYLSILLSSQNFDDFLSRTEIITSIVNYDNKIAKDLFDKKQQIIEVQNSLQKDKTELLTYKQNNENKLAEVQTDMQNQQKLIAEAQTRQAYYESQISDYKNKIAAEDKQVQDTISQLQALALAQAKNNQNNNSNNGVPPAPNAIVAYAYTFLGDPYVWGAEGDIFTQADIDMYKDTAHDLTGMEKLLGRQAFDCSGLMQYVYAHFGIHISRTTYTQINEGIPVDRSNLQPGDLIFFGTYDDPHHVGMYVGNNCFIQAPYSGDVVRVTSLDDTDEYLCARRIIH